MVDTVNYLVCVCVCVCVCVYCVCVCVLCVNYVILDLIYYNLVNFKTFSSKLNRV